jgi:hypothetical protein
MIMYKEPKTGEFGKPNAIIRAADEAFIPFDPDNTDYQSYLKWLAEGNVPTPADGGTE